VYKDVRMWVFELVHCSSFLFFSLLLLHICNSSILYYISTFEVTFIVFFFLLQCEYVRNCVNE
jgi:hypothetical protein